MSSYVYALGQQQFLSPDLICLSLVPMGPSISYQPGQYVDFIVDDLAIPMSIANLPNPSGELVFHMRVGDRAPLTEKIYQHLVQDKKIQIKGPKGHLHCQNVSTLHIIAGGTGISPCLALIESALDNQQIQQLALYWGISSLSDNFLQTHLGQLQKLYPKFSFEVVLSSPSPDWQGPTALIGPYAAQKIEPAPSMQIILSGPFEMVQQTQQLLVNKGIESQHIFSDMLG